MREFPSKSSYFSPQIFLPSWMVGWRRNLDSGEGVTYNPIREFFSNFLKKIGKFPLFLGISGNYFTFFGHFIHGSDRNNILLGDHYYQRPQNLARMDPFENPRGGTCPQAPPPNTSMDQAAILLTVVQPIGWPL